MKKPKAETPRDIAARIVLDYNRQLHTHPTLIDRIEQAIEAERCRVTIRPAAKKRGGKKRG